MSYNKRSNYSAVSIISFLAAIALDFFLVQLLKDKSDICRWLWLPLISIALMSISVGVASASGKIGALFTVPGIIWGIIRGIIMVAAYFESISGFWETVAAVFLCIFMFIFNAIPCFVFLAITGANDSESSSGEQRYSKPKYTEHRDEPSRREVRAPSRPRQGRLTDYFHSSCCAPQGGMYFWTSGPYMNSAFGSRSSYTVTGTIGIKLQSVEAFHVQPTDMDHHLDSVVYEVEKYVNEIIRNYQRDYPDDDTDFDVDIDLQIKVVNY